MKQADTPTLDPAVFHRNLSALRRTDPGLAGRIADLAVTNAASATPDATRDGKLNFKFHQPDGPGQWFGRTSIPSVRAEALLRQFDAGQANVLLPGIGQGFEAVLLTQRLGRHRAVFIWEESNSAVYLMLRLHDVANAIAEQRLVFLICPLAELTPRFLAWLEEHPGHLCPNRIMMWPWQSPAELAPARAAVEAAYQQIEQRRQEARLRLRSSLFTPSGPGRDTAEVAASAPPKPVIALLALHARDDVWTLTDALSHAARAAGCRPAKVDVRTPADIHPLARARRLAEQAEARPELAILIDLTRSEVADTLPDAVPAVSWLGPQATIDATLPSRAPATDPIAVTSNALLERAASFGIDPRRLTVCPPPCLAPLEADAPQDNAHRPIDVAIIADLGPTDAASFGHCLPTITQVWNTAVELLNGQIETLTENQVELTLARAEARSKIPITDASVREAIIRALSTSAAPAMLWRFIAQALVNADLTVGVYGLGWPRIPGAQLGGPACTIARRVEILGRAKIALQADFTGQGSLDTLLAAGCAAVLVARSHPRDTEPGGLRYLLEPNHEMVPFSRVPQLLETARRLVRSEPDRQRIATRARDRCRADHTPVARIQTLRAIATSFSADSRV